MSGSERMGARWVRWDCAVAVQVCAGMGRSSRVFVGLDVIVNLDCGWVGMGVLSRSVMGLSVLVSASLVNSSSLMALPFSWLLWSVCVMYRLLLVLTCLTSQVLLALHRWRFPSFVLVLDDIDAGEDTKDSS